MSGIVIRIIDTRVGRSFKNPTQFDFTCGPETPMNDLFAEIKKKCGARKIGSLQILSHAIYEPESTIKSPENKEGIIERFGFGVSFCSEGINEGTAGNFSAFRGMFASARGIFLQGCGVAATSTALKSVACTSSRSATARRCAKKSPTLRHRRRRFVRSATRTLRRGDADL
jgi:hypothetical protein